MWPAQWGQQGKEVSGIPSVAPAMVKVPEPDICPSFLGRLKEEGFLESGASISAATTSPKGWKRTWALKKDLPIGWTINPKHVI